MKHVTLMGAVWRMSDSNFKRLAADLKRGDGACEDLDNYGRMVIDRLYALDEVVQAVESDG